MNREVLVTFNVFLLLQSGARVAACSFAVVSRNFKSKQKLLLRSWNLYVHTAGLDQLSLRYDCRYSREATLSSAHTNTEDTFWIIRPPKQELSQNPAQTVCG